MKAHLREAQIEAGRLWTALERGVAAAESIEVDGVRMDAAVLDELCLSWDGIRAAAADPLVTIASHSVSHRNLVHLDGEWVIREIVGSAGRIGKEIGHRVRHFSYPYGGASACGRREFELARRAGCVSAVTTRPGMVFRSHAGRLQALPRVSINGYYQDRRYLPVLTSGLPTALWNGVRRLAGAA